MPKLHPTTILTTKKDQPAVKKNFPKMNLPLTIIPNYEEANEKIDLLFSIIESTTKTKEYPLLISTDQALITCANALGLETCFINTGSNDLISYKTTYEVKEKNSKIK